MSSQTQPLAAKPLKASRFNRAGWQFCFVSGLFYFFSLFFFSTTFLPSCVVRPLAIVSVICFGHWQLSCTCPILWAGAPCAECLFERGPYCGWVSSEWSWPLKASQKGLPKSLAETSITIRSRNWEPQSLCAQRISHVGSLSVPKKRDLNRSLFM